MISIRKAEWKDIDAVEQIYKDIHDSRREWQQEDQGQVVGAGIINQIQVDVYALGEWEEENTRQMKVCRVL